MTIGDILNFVTLQTGVDNTIYTNANRLISCNRWLQKVVQMIMQAQDCWEWDDINQTDYPIATTSLVASQRDYALPASLKILRLRRVDITYDGTNWYRAEPWDSTETGLGLGNDANTDNNFDKTKPYYDITNNSIFVYPMATASDVAAGAKLRIEFQREPIEFTSSDFTTGTKLPPFDAPLHSMLAWGMVYDWSIANNLKQLKADAQGELQELEQRLKWHYGRKNIDRQFVMKAAFIDYN